VCVGECVCVCVYVSLLPCPGCSLLLFYGGRNIKQIFPPLYSVADNAAQVVLVLVVVVVSVVVVGSVDFGFNNGCSALGT
jgi:hypothetical protein